MFTTYIKNLNDLVFSTSESPEEQQSTGVLGRIGSWLSPWRGKSPKSPTENASSTSDPALQSEGEQESEESVRVWARSQTWEENNEQSSDPNPLRLPRDILPRAEGDATQSAHRTGPIVSSTDTAVGGPKEEEFVACRKKTFGQGKEREEGSNHTSASGNPQKNASHLTHLSSSTEQGVVWDSDQDHTRSQTQTKAHAQTGRRLHVYLEETSVIQCNPNTSVGQEVVEVTKKNLKVLSKAKSTPSFGLSSSPETKRTNVRPVVGSQSYYSALVGVSLKSRKDSPSEAEPKGQTEVDSMGRKNAARRKFRKNSQGDEVQSPQEKTPPKTLPVPEGIPTSDNSVTSPQSGSANSHMGELAINSASKHNPTFLTSPEGVESEIPLPDTTKPLDNFQDSSSVTAAALACVVDGGVDMEDDSLYKVERKTETAESKRRSIKVSRSEVKLFTKNVPFTPKQSPAGATQEFKAAPKNIKDEEKETPKAEIGERIHDLKKIDEEPKIVTGRIADKISLFERPAMGVNKQVFKTPRSADVSPVRKVTDRMKEDFTLSEKRSRSAERHEAARSSSASPEKKPMSIKERARNFMEASRTALPEKPNMTGISQKDISSTAAAAKSPKLDHQGKLDTVEQIQKAKSEITLKPDGQDTTTVGAKPPIPKKQATDSKTNPTVSAEQDVKPKSVETDGPAKGTGDSAELTNSLSPQSRGSSRTGSRSKRRKSREPTSPTGEKKPTSPISPTGEKKPTSPISPTGEKKPIIPISKPELTPLKQQQVDHTEEVASISKNLTKRASLPDIKQKAFQKESEVFDDQKKLLDSSFKKETGDRQEGLPEPSINKDEPDTAARGSGTKAPIDKEPVILPPKEEKAAGNSLTLTQREEKVSKDSRETSSSSSRHVPQQPVEKTCLMEQDPLVKNPKLEKDILVQAEAKRNKKHTGQTTLRPNKETELINQAESKDVDKLEKAESEKTNEEKNKETAQQLLHSNKDTRKVIVSEGSQSISGQEERTVRNDERKNAEKKDETQPVKVVTNPELARRSSDTDTSTHLPAQKQTVRQTKTTRSEKAVSTVSQTNELVRESVPLQAADQPSESKTKYAESPGTETETAGIAAKAQPQVSVEKTDSSLDDSCAHGGNDSQLLSSKSITKATKAAEKMTVKAGEAIPALIGTQTDTVSESESHVKESSAISVSGSESSTVAGQGDGEKSLTVKSLPSEVSGDVLKLSPRHRQRKESKNAESTSDTTALKCAEKIAQSLSDSAASSSSFKVQGEAAEKTVHSPVNEPSLVANGDISPKLHTVKKERVKSQTPKAPTLAEANKGIPALKMLSFRPRGLGKDDSSSGQDTPSSWLDVDFPKQKLKVAAPKLSSSGSESNLLDSPGELDDDFVERIKKLCAPFSLPPRKHSQLRPPQPPFAMPAIREDRFEKTFDPDEFKFGLRKNNQFKIDTTPGLMAAKNKEVKPGLKPARASLADRSMLLSILDTHSRLRDSTPVKEEEEAKEEKDDQVKVRSRLEGSCVFSGLTSSILRGKRNGVEAEGTNSGDVSPTETPHLSPPPTSLQPPPSPTASHSSTLAPSYKEKAQAVETVVSDSVPPFPSFNDIKLPDYLEKYLPREPEKPVQSIQGQEQVRTEVLGKMTNAAAGGEAVKPGVTLPDGLTPRLPEIPPVTNPELKQPLAQPQGIRSPKMRAAKGFHKRPGKMVLFEKAQFSGQAHEIYRDVEDATSLQLSPLISVKVVRGCWVLYEKPDFKGRSIALEEGSIELTNMWAEAGLETEPQNNPAMQIGSIRLTVWDYSLPHIDLFTEPEGRGRVTPYHDDTIETGSFGIPLNTASIQVHSGVWLLFSDPGFQGMIAVLETGEYPFPETWGFPSPFVGSLRPLKMGGFKVENPNEIKAVVYEKPGFEGSWMEIDSDVFSFCESEDNGELDSTKLKSVGSLKIIGGLWVGYCEPGFEGQQFILEEGEYLDCSDWGGSEELCSLRPVVADFMSPHLKMFSDIQFGDLGVNIDITVPVIDMEGTGYGLKTQSIDVISGVWVVFEEPGFCGESYILEKGLYGCPEDWGGLQPRLASAMPVALDDFENAAKFNVQLFSEAAFQGSVLHLEDSLASLQDGVSVASCKVLAGSWMAFEGRDFTGRMYVLEVGNYPDLRAMGCTTSTTIIQSLQTVGFEFSLPSITLFERSGLRGKRTVLTDGSVNLQLAGGCSRVQSVLVEGGMWVLYEGINYRGPQILLKPGEVPDWRKFSSWQKIGSLRPLVQKRAYFRLRNRQSGLMMSLTGDLDDVKLMRIQETEETDGFEQIWFYQHGHLHCKLLEECCLSPSGSVTMAGSRVGLAPEPENQTHLWSITPEGFIRYSPTADLVLEVKGGAHYDKNQVILKTLDPHKLQQRWDVEIL